MLNAFSLEMADLIRAHLEAFARDDDVRVVVIRGAGRVFSAGGDIKFMVSAVRAKNEAAYFEEPLTSFHQVTMALRRLEKPVLAAVHGAVAGYSWNLVLACDMVLAMEGTRFSQAFVRLGLSPDGGGTFFLPRLIGYARACELAMLPDEIDAQGACDWGLVNWVVAPDEFETRLDEITGKLVRGPAGALGRVKRLLNRSLLSSLEEHLEDERLAQVANAQTGDFAEGLQAFVERRAPRFSGVK